MHKFITILSQIIKFLYALFRYDPWMRLGVLLTFTCLDLMQSSPFIFMLSIKFLNIDPSISFGPENKIFFDVAVLLGFLFGLYLLFWSFRSGLKTAKNLLIMITGMPGMQTQSIIKNLPRHFRMSLEIIKIDFSDLFVSDDPLAPSKMLKKILSIPDRINEKLSDQKKEVSLLFAGLAPIPILVCAGKMISDRQNITIMDRSQDISDWNLLLGIDNNDAIEIVKNIDGEQEDLALILPFSIRINEHQIPKALLKSHIKIELKGGAKRDSLSSEHIQKRIAQEINEICSNIRGEHPKIKRLHIYMAAQASFAVRLGTKISNSVMPEVRVYNFDAQNNCYPWHIKFTRNNDPEFVQSSCI